MSTARKLDRPAAKHETLQPQGWPQPKGYANGIKARGEFVFVGGMVGWDEQERFPEGFVAQAKQALPNIVAVLAEGGARPEHVVRLTWYVLDMDEYLGARKALGAVYREVMGDHFPAMALVQVGRLFEQQGAARDRGHRGAAVVHASQRYAYQQASAVSPSQIATMTIAPAGAGRLRRRGRGRHAQLRHDRGGIIRTTSQMPSGTISRSSR